jgi:3-methyladenine DNA glycosylase AlkD
LATNVVGVVLKRYPKEMPHWNERWVTSEDLWLIRTSILFQLKWRHDTDQALLFANIDRHAGHTDFFIRKAIGWALRHYGRTNPEAVHAYVAARKLSPLSVREALRRL